MPLSLLRQSGQRLYIESRRRSAADYGKSRRLPLEAEEKTLIWRCDILQRAGFPQTVQDVRDLAQTLIRKRDPTGTVSHRWIYSAKRGGIWQWRKTGKGGQQLGNQLLGCKRRKRRRGIACKRCEDICYLEQTLEGLSGSESENDPVLGEDTREELYLIFRSQYYLNHENSMPQSLKFKNRAQRMRDMVEFWGIEDGVR
jgi:hypothetical protein